MNRSRPIPLSNIRNSPSTLFLHEDPEETHSGEEEVVFSHSLSFEVIDKDSAAPTHPKWKRDLFTLLEQPASSPAAFVIHVLTTTLIVLSSLVTVLETIPAFHEVAGSVWFGLETTLVVLFTVEYVARCIAWTKSWKTFVKWVGSFYGIIDLLAILPYYIEIGMQQDTSVFFRFSILRVFRLLRVFRPFRSNNTILLTIEVMYLSLRRSQHALLALSFFVIMILTVFSTLLYFAERGTWDITLETFLNSDGDPSQFSSIPAAAWFVLVTITTVGYGEITPRSFLGRLITLPLLLFGLLLIALPSFVLGREFSLVWEEMAVDKAQASEDGTHSPMPNPLVPARRDLSNRKLARNQTELSRQIAELKATVEAQGEILRILLEKMTVDGSEKALGEMSIGEHGGRGWTR